MPYWVRAYRIAATLIVALLLLLPACSSKEPSPPPDTQAGVDITIPLTVLAKDPKIQIINFSSYPIEEFVHWTNSASKQMASRESSILVLLYDVGQARRPEIEIPETPFSEHEVLLSLTEQESLLSGINHWLEQDSCMGKKSRFTNEEMDKYRLWIERGADASTQVALCPRTRVVVIALTDSLRNREPRESLQTLFIHEMYHAFQQDLEDEGSCGSGKEKADSNTHWMVEGGAHYFSTMLVAQMQDSKNGVNQVLQDALRTSLDEGTDILTSSQDRTGAGALRLMIERELITEKSIMDGSFFHTCSRELEFDSKSPEIQFIRDHWYKIQETNNEYYFEDNALVGSLGQS